MEILAPAGSKEAFLAAVNNGANAVYLSGKQFGARAYASNFSIEEIDWAVQYAHLRQVKVYVTVNTLLADTELQAALDFVAALYHIGVDAIIIQDWGLINLIRQYYPQVPLNASTQMTFHNSAGCQMASELGFQRVILAREVSIPEMAAINQCLAQQTQPLETEVFVHGALCVCYSGQCLFSSLVGGRSGNRGRCAQPCRLKYQLLDGKGNVVNNAHLLSPKDLKGIEHLADIEAAGVVSAKIEGRMKRPEYVATVVAAYAKANCGNIELEAEKTLKQAFNREFTSGYLLKEQGRDLMSYQRPNNRGTKLGRIEAVSRQEIVVKLDDQLSVGDGLEIWVSKGGRQGFTVEGIQVGQEERQQALKGEKVALPILHANLNCKYILPGDRVFKTLDSKLNKSAQATFLQTDTLALKMFFQAKIGSKPVLRLMDQEQHCMTHEADFTVPKAEKHPSDEASVKKQLARLGGSGYYLAELQTDLQEGCMIPASVLNNMRRDALQALQQQILQQYSRDRLQPVNLPNVESKHQKRPGLQLSLLVDSIECAQAAIRGNIGIIYINGCKWQGQEDLNTTQLAALTKNGKSVYITLPVIAKEKELAYWQKKMPEWLQAGIKGFVIGSLWPLQLAKAYRTEAEWIGDFPLNLFNSQAGNFFARQGIKRLGISNELNWTQIQQLQGDWEKEVLLFGNLKMMVSEHCVLGAACGNQGAETKCNRPCLQKGTYRLKDDKGFTFPIRADQFCRSHLYNGYLLCLLEDMQKFAASGISVARLDVSFLPPQTVEAVANSFDQTLQKLQNGIQVDWTTEKQRLAQLVGQPFTKGHYYRGVE